ncbi:MAG: DUF2510 domain-containing protein [Acidimicrobiia bacterium]
MTKDNGSWPADWYADPTGSADLRCWDGNAWTPDVSRRGQSLTDPVTERPEHDPDRTPRSLVRATGSALRRSWRWRAGDEALRLLGASR